MESKWVAALFVKFQVLYGNKWTSNYPSHELRTLAIEEWSRMLGGLSAEEIRRGLDTWKGEWPPTAGEFRSVCEPIRKKAAHKLFQALPRPEPSREEGLRHIAKMKEMLKKTATDEPKEEKEPPIPADREYFKRMGWQPDKSGESRLSPKPTTKPD